MDIEFEGGGDIRTYDYDLLDYDDDEDENYARFVDLNVGNQPRTPKAEAFMLGPLSMPLWPLGFRETLGALDHPLAEPEQRLASNRRGGAVRPRPFPVSVFAAATR